MGKEWSEFLGKEWSAFLGKEWSAFLGKEWSQFMGRWPLCTTVVCFIQSRSPEKVIIAYHMLVISSTL